MFTRPDIRTFLSGRLITWLTCMIWLSCMMSPVHAAGLSVASGCNPVAQSACSLPFPSDLFRNTAGKLNYSNRIMDRRTSGTVHELLPVASQLPTKFTPANILNDSRGFSALGPVAFELPAFPEGDIAEDGQGVLIVFDRDTLQNVPMRVSLSKIANPQRELREKSAVIIAWPRSRFDFEKRYVAVLLRTGLSSADLAHPQMQPSEGMQRVLDGNAGYFVQNAYAPILDAVAQKGIARDDILSLTYFTVRPEAEVTSPLQQMVAQATRQPLAIYDIRTRNALGSKDYEYATYEGHMRLVNFRDQDGGIYPPYAPLADAQLERAEFILSLPKPEQAESVPVTLWGHGLANDKALAKSAFTRYDDLGMATFAIDHPNHASRVISVGNKAPHIAALVRSPQNMMHLLGMFVQSSIDFAVTAQTVHDVLPETLDVVRQRDATTPRIDPQRMVYQGVSLGGMVGATVGTTAPYLQGAFLINGASSLMQIFSESVMWDGNTSTIIPFNANGAEAVFILAMMQHYVDIADGNNFAQYFRSPPSGQEPRKLGMLYAVGDGSLTNNASLATADIARLPLLKEVVEPVGFLPYGQSGSNGHVDGYGILQSGFGSEDADRVLDQLESFDPTANTGANNEALGILQQFAALAEQAGPFSEISQLVLNGLLPGSQADSFTAWIHSLYQGDMESFLTHFNRNSLEAVSSNIDWACDLLALDAGRCAFAKQKAAEAEQTDTGETPELPDDIIDRAEDALDDFLESGTVTVNVNSGSGGSIEAWTLALLACFLFALRHARGRITREILTGWLRSPLFRTFGSALLSLLTWGGWALFVNGWRSPEGMTAALSQGLASFVTTFAGSALLEWLFVRLGPGWGGCIVSAALVSSTSLTLMLIVHVNMHTPHILLTVAPIYAIVVMYCLSYVATLKRLSAGETQMICESAAAHE